MRCVDAMWCERFEMPYDVLRVAGASLRCAHSWSCSQPLDNSAPGAGSAKTATRAATSARLCEDPTLSLSDLNMKDEEQEKASRAKKSSNGWVSVTRESGALTLSEPSRNPTLLISPAGFKMSTALVEFLLLVNILLRTTIPPTDGTHLIILVNFDIQYQIPHLFASLPVGIRRPLRPLYSNNNFTHNFKLAPVDPLFTHNTFEDADARVRGQRRIRLLLVADKGGIAFRCGDEIAAVERYIWYALARTILPGEAVRGMRFCLAHKDVEFPEILIGSLGH